MHVIKGLTHLYKTYISINNELIFGGSKKPERE